MSPEEQPVSVREFERSHAEIREDMNKMRQENTDDHAKVVEAIEKLREDLAKVVTWPQLAALIPVLVGLVVLAFVIVGHA